MYGWRFGGNSYLRVYIFSTLPDSLPSSVALGLLSNVYQTVPRKHSQQTDLSLFVFTVGFAWNKVGLMLKCTRGDFNQSGMMLKRTSINIHALTRDICWQTLGCIIITWRLIWFSSICNLSDWTVYSQTGFRTHTTDPLYGENLFKLPVIKCIIYITFLAYEKSPLSWVQLLKYRTCLHDRNL